MTHQIESVAADIEAYLGLKVEVIKNWIGWGMFLPAGAVELNLTFYPGVEGNHFIHFWLRFCDEEGRRKKLPSPYLKTVTLCGVMQQALSWGTLVPQRTESGSELSLFRQIEYVPPLEEDLPACLESVLATLDRLVMEWSVINQLLRQRDKFPLDQSESLIQLIEFVLADDLSYEERMQ